MADISSIIERIEALQFDIEKAEFNENATDELITQLKQAEQELVQVLTERLVEQVPRRLPPLQVHNPHLQFPPDADPDLVDVIDDVGLKEDEDSSLVLQLDKSDPLHQELINLLGSYYMHQGQPEEASGYFTEIVDTGPVVRFNLSYALAVQNVHRPALDHLESIPSDINQADIELNKAVIFDRLGRFEEADAHFQDAVEQAEDPSMYLFNWGLSAKGFGKLDEAGLILSRLYGLEPTYPDLAYQLGEIYAQQGNYPKAIEYFEQAHEQEPTNLEYLSDLGTACLMAEQYLDAIEYYTSYLEEETSITVLNNLGAAYLKTNQFEQAAEILDEAVELDPSHEQSRRNREVARSYLE